MLQFLLGGLACVAPLLMPTTNAFQIAPVSMVTLKMVLSWPPILVTYEASLHTFAFAMWEKRSVGVPSEDVVIDRLPRLSLRSWHLSGSSHYRAARWAGEATRAVRR